MKIVVIGGTGLIGTRLVHNLRKQGHEVVPASPSSGVNTLTGEGLAEALVGAKVVVDVVVGPGRPRDYSLGLPQIRTCTLMHPVRHVVEYRCPSRD